MATKPGLRPQLETVSGLFYFGQPMDNNYLQKLAAALMRTNTGAGNAANALNSREYQLYAQEAKAMGEQIMTPQQFAMQKQAPQPVQQQPEAAPQPFRF